MPTYKQPLKRVPGSLKVVELFETVQGEGIHTGVPSVFFRTGACNLECSGCDTKWDDWTETRVGDAADKIAGFNANHVVFTGGEPTLWQQDLGMLMHAIDAIRPDMEFTVETNGAVPIRNGYLLERVDLFSFSPKVGSLGHDEKFSHDVVVENLVITRGGNQIKYVLDPNVPEHVESVFAFQKRLDDEGFVVPDDRVFFQPLDTETLVNIYHAPGLDDRDTYLRRFAALTKLVMERSGSRFRVQPQLHKLLSYR